MVCTGRVTRCAGIPAAREYQRDVAVIAPRRAVHRGNGQTIEVVDEAVWFKDDIDIARPARTEVPQHGFDDGKVGRSALLAKRCSIRL